MGSFVTIYKPIGFLVSTTFYSCTKQSDDKWVNRSSNVKNGEN